MFYITNKKESKIEYNNLEYINVYIIFCKISQSFNKKSYDFFLIRSAK